MQVILLSYPGISGEAAIAGYSGMVPCSSLEMSTTDSTASVSPSGYGGTDENESEGLKTPGAGVSSPRVGMDSLQIEKLVDKATPKFLEKAFAKKADGAQATIVVLRAFPQSVSDLNSDLANVTGTSSVSPSGSQTPYYWYKQYMLITLTDVNISYHHVSVGEDEAKETIKISFKKLTLEYVVFQNGAKTGTVSGTVDLTQQPSS